VHKFWGVVFGVVIFLEAALFGVAPFVGWWLPKNVSTFGGEVDALFYLIYWITGFFFLLTEAILVYNIYRFGEMEPGRKVPYVHGNHRLEMVWTVVPAVILVLISLLQIGSWEKIKYYKNMPKPDATVCQLVVVARQWEWRVRYPSPDEMRRWEKDAEGAVNWSRLADYPYEDFPQFDDVQLVNEIHCWKVDEKGLGRVLIHLKTRDVLHSFFLPHMRLKQDAVPGKVIQVWFGATEANCATQDGIHWLDGWDEKTNTFVDADGRPHADNIWDLACAEFCGARHSMMKGKLYVHKDKADFLAWLQQAKQLNEQRVP
jgi:cytochrome c oxidase subunit 2